MAGAGIAEIGTEPAVGQQFADLGHPLEPGTLDILDGQTDRS